MPEFQMDKRGVIVMRGHAFAYVTFADLDAFAQGYVEAVFFTSGDPPGSFNGSENGEDEDLRAVRGFGDLAPRTLATIIADCAAFQASRAWLDCIESWDGADESDAGHDFWMTRNGHGCGFWDGDWPAPHGDTLTAESKRFGMCDAYLSDDGKVYA